MGTLPEIVEEIVRADNGGVFTDEQKQDMDYMESVVHEYRAQAIFLTFNKTRRINPAWTQKCEVTLDEDAQESEKYALFKVPQPVSLGQFMDGHMYVGSVCGTRNFRKCTSRADLANRNNHRYTRVKQDIEKVVYSDLCYEVYGNTELKKLLVDGVMMYPTEVPTYNKWVDPYPISPDVLTIMKSFVIQETRPAAQAPSDTKSDSQHTTTAINVQK